MKVVVYRPRAASSDTPGRVGVLVGDKVVDLNQANPSAPADLLGLIEAGQRGLDMVRQVTEAAGTLEPGKPGVLSKDAVKLLAPVPGPASRIPCAGGNFAKHSAGIIESQTGKPTSPEEVYKHSRERGPWGFWKIVREVLATDDDVEYPSRTKRFDYEGEVAAVIGRKLRDANQSQAREAIWGLVLLNDWSIRDSGEEARAITFNLSKNFDSCTSLGPIISIGELDPQNVDVTTTVNGEVRQNYNTSDMTFSFAEYLEFITRDLTLYPGDVFSGGTGPGTALDSSRKNPDGTLKIDNYLRVGNLVEVASPELGVLRNRIVGKGQ